MAGRQPGGAGRSGPDTIKHSAGRQPGGAGRSGPDTRCPDFDNGGVRQPVLGVHPDLAA
ncbi:hypothetical protein [Mycolicibacter minnesotensis]|uniref:hypothetical protein n=1 Tax=Mycolicibacter minnesotensis TaxID=1118379 RepID=UPI0013D463AB